MSRGTIVLVPFPFTDLSGQKIRPALVLHAQRRGEDVIVCFISSQKGGVRGAYDSAVKGTERNGLKVDSIVRVTKIATLEKKIIMGELGELEAIHMKKISGTIRELFS